MKKIYALLFLIGAYFSSASQNISGGIRLGMNVANNNVTTIASSITPDAKIGFLAGGYLSVMLTDKFGIQPELVYSTMGSSSSSVLTSQGTTIKAVDDLKFSYLSLPVMLRFNLTDNFNLQVGPQLGYLLSATETASASGLPTISADIKSSLNDIDFGAAAGLGVDFGKFNAGARYYLGFTNLVKNTTGSANKLANNSIQIYIGYSLFGGN